MTSHQDPECGGHPVYLREEQPGRGEYLHQGARADQHLEGPENARHQLHSLHWGPARSLYGFLPRLLIRDSLLHAEKSAMEKMAGI